jgi:hypothetical protein
MSVPSMASHRRPLLPRRAWTLEEAALFAARREYELLRLLSQDAKVLRAARRLRLPLSSSAAALAPAKSLGEGEAARRGAPRGDQAVAVDGLHDARHVHPRPAGRRARRAADGAAAPAVATAPTPAPASATGGGATGAPVDGASIGGAAPRANARRRRSAERSARRHVRRSRPIRTAALALMFISKLCRGVRLRRNLVELDDLACHVDDDALVCFAAADAKRARPASRTSSSEAGMSDSSGDLLGAGYDLLSHPIARSVRAPPAKRREGGVAALVQRFAAG